MQNSAPKSLAKSYLYPKDSLTTETGYIDAQRSSALLLSDPPQEGCAWVVFGSDFGPGGVRAPIASGNSHWFELPGLCVTND